MRRSVVWLASILAIGAAAIAVADVTLTAEQRENLGIESVVLARESVPRVWRSTGQVMDVASLTASLSDLHAAREMLAASEAELRRSERLFHDDVNVSRKMLEAAQAQRAVDAARVTTLEGQVRSVWGSNLLGGTPATRERLARDLRTGKTSLVRLDLTTSLPQSTSTPEVELQSLDGEAHWPAVWVGVLPQGASATLGGTVLVRTTAALVSGQLVTAQIREAKASLAGIAIPSAAIVRWHGIEWFYVEQATNEFARRSLREAAPVRGQRLLPLEGVESLRVVQRGARSLLAVEIGSDDTGAAEGAKE